MGGAAIYSFSVALCRRHALPACRQSASSSTLGSLHQYTRRGSYFNCSAAWISQVLTNTTRVPSSPTLAPLLSHSLAHRVGRDDTRRVRTPTADQYPSFRAPRISSLPNGCRRTLSYTDRNAGTYVCTSTLDVPGARRI